MPDSGSSQQGVFLNVEGLTVDGVERMLTEAYHDPVKSRLLEAARAQLVMSGKYSSGQEADAEALEAASRWHIDIHSCW